MVGGCGNAADQGFAYELSPGKTIQIGMASTTFDSMHSLRFGGSYPGLHEVDCVDEPDGKEIKFTNEGAQVSPVYFVVDAYFGDEAFGRGNFVLEWEVYGEPHVLSHTHKQY